MWRIPLLAAVLASWLFTAHAGEPAPCDGHETMVCDNGLLRARCCPKGARCNFRSSPHVDCGGGYCAVGRDVGRCPAPKPTTTGENSKDACKASWEPACVANKVTQACIMPVPTNYSGPERNPR